jgi:hypothetical protein
VSTRIRRQSAIPQRRCGHRGKAEGVVQLAICEQAAVTGELSTMELQLDPAVEGNSEDGLLGFTRRIRHPAPARQPRCC